LAQFRNKKESPDRRDARKLVGLDDLPAENFNAAPSLYRLNMERKMPLSNLFGRDSSANGAGAGDGDTKVKAISETNPNS
jgi:hypothetical protein